LVVDSKVATLANNQGLSSAQLDNDWMIDETNHQGLIGTHSSHSTPTAPQLKVDQLYSRSGNPIPDI
jgi:hypothetical protein